MAKFERIADIPCPFLKEAAEKALVGAEKKMKPVDALQYLKKTADCTEPCSKAGEGCRRIVTAKIVAEDIEIVKPLLGPTVIFSRALKTITLKTNSAVCPEEKLQQSHE